MHPLSGQRSPGNEKKDGTKQINLILVLSEVEMGGGGNPDGDRDYGKSSTLPILHRRPFYLGQIQDVF